MMKDNALKDSIQKILDNEAELAKENELLIGIDPKSYLGCEILKQSREIIALRTEIQELKKIKVDQVKQCEELKTKMLKAAESLLNWNEKYTEGEPEQARKNLETVTDCLLRIPHQLN